MPGRYEKISNFFHILPSRYNKKEMLQRLVRQFADFMTAITQRCLSWHLYSCTLSYKISNEIQNALHLIAFFSPCYQYCFDNEIYSSIVFYENVELLKFKIKMDAFQN